MIASHETRKDFVATEGAEKNQKSVLPQKGTRYARREKPKNLLRLLRIFAANQLLTLSVWSPTQTRKLFSTKNA
jgi:hypothetical protein